MLAEADTHSDDPDAMQCDVLTVARLSDGQRHFCRGASAPRGADKTEEGGLCVYVHGLAGGWLDAIRAITSLSTVHAGEITHLSISVGLSQCGQPDSFEEWALFGPEAAFPFGPDFPHPLRLYAAQLTSLRVLEVLQVCPTELTLPGMVALSLVQSTASTLRSLVIIGAGWPQQKLVEMLRAAGPTLHQLCLVVVECDCFIDIQTDEAARDHTHCLLELSDLAHDDDERMEDEMKTEMLRNSAEGLCISLHEPARILAHVPTQRTEFAQVLPDPSWFE